MTPGTSSWCISLRKVGMGLLLPVYLMVVGVQAGEEECLGNFIEQFNETNGPIYIVVGYRPIYCYDCTADSDDHYCSDPFNNSHPALQKVACRSYCVKWSRTTLSGRSYYQRTCSDNVMINMRKSVVCIEESRPSKGQLCFCDKDKCNHGSMPTTLNVTFILFLALFITWMFSNSHLR